jgi:hypothetical protein
MTLTPTQIAGGWWSCGGCGKGHPPEEGFCQYCMDEPITEMSETRRRLSPETRGHTGRKHKRNPPLGNLDLHQQACLMLMQRSGMHSEKFTLHGRRNQYTVYVAGGCGMCNARHDLGVHRQHPDGTADDPLVLLGSEKEMLTEFHEWEWTDVTADGVTTLLWAIISGTGEPTKPNATLRNLLQKAKPTELLTLLQEEVQRRL